VTTEEQSREVARIAQQQQDAVFTAARKLERIHDSLVADGISADSIVRIWEAALDLRRLHHSIRVTK
jgi:hypothetical protein